MNPANQTQPKTRKIKNKTALIYLRADLASQAAEKTALSKQREACLRYIKDAGYGFVEDLDIYFDVSGSDDSKNRPGLKTILKRCYEDGNVKAVIVNDVSRLSESSTDFYEIQGYLNEMGKTLRSVTGK